MIRLHSHTSQRDDDALIAETLCAHWRDFYGSRFEPTRTGQAWVRAPRSHALTSVDAVAEVVTFQRDELRFTPLPSRAVPQYILGTVLNAGWVRRSLQSVVFRVSPPLPDARQLLIIPGNRRLRILDFGRRTSRSVMKMGYHPAPVEREVKLRTAAPDAIAAGMMLPIVRAALDSNPAWFEEPLVWGWPLPRCPPWVDRRRGERRALEALASWQRAHPIREVRADAYIDELFEHAASASPRRHLLEQLGAAARGLRTVTVAMSHGDLQPGNIMVPRPHPRSLGAYVDVPDSVLVDWEYTGERFDAYDLLCYGLRARYGGDLGHRARAYVQRSAKGKDWASVRGLLPDHSLDWRRGAVALFFLEELRWALDDAATTPRPDESRLQRLMNAAEVFLHGRLATTGNRQGG